MRIFIRRSRFGLRTVPLVLLLLLLTLLLAAPAQGRVLKSSIKGTVLDAATGKGVAGVRVFVMEKVYPWGPGTPGQDYDWEPIADASTSKGGSYTVTLPRAGTFRVFFVPADRTRWAMEAYPNAPVPQWGDDVVVKYGKATSGVSAKLDPSNRIEGHIYDARSRWDTNGDPVDQSEWHGLKGIHVYASFQGLVRINSHLGEEPLADAYTDEQSFYSIPGFKAPYPFFVWVFDEDGTYPQFVDRIIQDPSTDDFPGGVKTLTGWLQPDDFVNLRGRLVDEAGEPLIGKTVRVWISDNSPELERPFCSPVEVSTNAGGYFESVNLPEPACLLEVWGDEEFQPEFYDDAEFWNASEIPIDWGRTNDIGDWVISHHPDGQ